MAFVRAWAEGLDAVAAWHRYLAGHGPADLRLARAELQRLLDVLRGLARAHGREDIAVLLRRDPEAMGDAAPAAISLDEFITQQPADFYSESELVALYETAHGGLDARGAARRRQRLRARLLDALHWLQRLAVRAPQADDLVSAWLDERVARRLAAVGLLRLGELHQHVCTSGYHWHRRVPRLGPSGAARVLHWLRTQAPGLGALPDSALRPPRSLDFDALAPAPSLGVVPLERLALPPALDGSAGTNRAAHGGTGAVGSPDVAAVQAWLARWPQGSHTWRAYRREAERWLLWSTLVRRKPLSSLTSADCALYRAFLLAPGAPWCAPRHSQRWSPAWRPFEAGLSSRSADTALAIVHALSAWLVRHGHLAHNPWTAAPPLARAAASGPVSPGHATPVRASRPELAPASTGAGRRGQRSLSVDQWVWVQTWLQQQPPSPARHRLAFALRLGVETGWRLSTLCAARTDWLCAAPGDDGSLTWHLRLPAALGTAAATDALSGVGGASSPGAAPGPGLSLPLSAALCEALLLHLAHRGGNPVASAPQTALAEGDPTVRPRPPAHGPADASALDASPISGARLRPTAPCPEADAPTPTGPVDALRAWADAQAPVPLIGRLTDGAALSPARLYAVLRAGFGRCASAIGPMAAVLGDGAMGQGGADRIALRHASAGCLRGVHRALLRRQHGAQPTGPQVA